MKLTDRIRKRPARDTNQPLSPWRTIGAALILAGIFVALIILLGPHHH